MICYLQKIYFTPKEDTNRLKVRGEKKYSMQLATKRKKGVAILIQDKIHFKSKIVARDKEGCYNNENMSSHQEGIILISIYALNIRDPKFMKQPLTELKGERDSCTII